MVRRSRGFSLIELVIFIVVVAVALTGVLALYQQATARSGDAIASRQALEAGYALLEEIQAMPFTFCTAENASAPTATSTSTCYGEVQGLTPTAGKSRGHLTTPFSNVGDYGGYSQTGVTDINGQAAPGLSSHRISVALSQPALPGVPAASVIRIDVTVAGPHGSQVITGYRVRHSPNALP